VANNGACPRPTAAAGRQAFGAVLAGRGSHGEYPDSLHSDAHGHGPLHRRDVCFMERGLCWRPWHLSGVSGQELAPVLVRNRSGRQSVVVRIPDCVFCSHTPVVYNAEDFSRCH